MAKPTILPIWDTDETNSIEPDSDHKLDGWLNPGGLPEKPPFQTFNFWQNAVYKWIKEINQQGILQYDALTDYPIGALVMGSSEIYIAAAANGPATAVKNPVGDATGVWENFYFNTSSNVVTGTADAIILNAISGINPSALFDGQLFTFKAISSNIGAMTVQVGALAAKSLTHGDGTAMLSGEIGQDDYGQIAYNKSLDRYEKASIGRDVPAGEKILFYKNTVVIGYLLLDTLDDKVVYVTKGSAAGGQTGGAVHSSGSWTQPNHSHQHNHKWLVNDGATEHEKTYNISGTSVAIEHSTINNTYKKIPIFTDSYAGLSDAWTNNDLTQGATVNTWRPAAYCFTMQQRS